MLYQCDAEILFPSHLIPSLRDLRGKDWNQFVEDIATKKECDPDKLAFSLMMIRLNGCLNCNADSFRALQGCAHCACHSVRRFKGSDQELIERWQAARADVLGYLNSGRIPKAD